MTHLAESLKKYYKRRSNRLVFREGFSLNELAMAIWQQMGYRGIDSSVLSKIINGKSLPTLEQLTTLSKLLKLTENQFIDLSKSLAKDLLISKGFVRELNINNRISLNEINESMKKLRLSGFPEYAIQIGNAVKLITKLNLLTYHSKKLAELFFNMDLELVRSYGESANASKICALTEKLNLSCLEQVNLTSNRQLIEMAYMNYGGCLYVGKEWLKSSSFLEAKVRNVNEITQLEMYRTLLLDYAYLKDLKKYKRILKKATCLLNKTHQESLNERISLLEAVARSLSYFGFISEAKSLISNVDGLKVTPFFQSQVIRCKAIILKQTFKTNGKFDLYEVEKIKESISSPIFCQYTRHLTEINNIISTLEQ